MGWPPPPISEIASSSLTVACASSAEQHGTDPLRTAVTKSASMLIAGVSATSSTLLPCPVRLQEQLPIRRPQSALVAVVDQLERRRRSSPRRSPRRRQILGQPDRGRRHHVGPVLEPVLEDDTSSGVRPVVQSSASSRCSPASQTMPPPETRGSSRHDSPGPTRVVSQGCVIVAVTSRSGPTAPSEIRALARARAGLKPILLADPDSQPPGPGQIHDVDGLLQIRRQWLLDKHVAAGLEPDP